MILDVWAQAVIVVLWAIAALALLGRFLVTLAERRSARSRKDVR